MSNTLIDTTWLPFPYSRTTTSFLSSPGRYTSHPPAGTLRETEEQSPDGYFFFCFPGGSPGIQTRH